MSSRRSGVLGVYFMVFFSTFFFNLETMTKNTVSREKQRHERRRSGPKRKEKERETRRSDSP